MPTIPVKTCLNRVLFSLVIIIIIFICLEAFSLGGLFILGKWKKIFYTPLPRVSLSEYQNEVIRKLIAGRIGHVIYDFNLGWTLQPSAKTDQYQINSRAIRSDNEYNGSCPVGKKRIAAFGDSFTFGQGVTNGETWEQILETLDPRLEVLNFGVGGYGQDQAYLRYLKEGQAVHPDIVLIGFISENVFRNLNMFRPFYNPLTEFPLTKPRFQMNGDSMVLLENPMKELDQYRLLLSQPEKTIRWLGQNDYFYHQLYHRGAWDRLALIRLIKVIQYNFTSTKRYDSLFFKDDIFNIHSEGYQLGVKLIDEFYQKAVQNGSVPVIVILPTKRDLGRLAAGAEKRYRPFLDEWINKKYEVLDINEIVYREGIDVFNEQWYTQDGHNSGRLNRKIAVHLQEYLDKMKKEAVNKR